AGDGVQGGSCRGRRIEHGRAHPRPGPSVAVFTHAARLPAHLADVDGLVDIGAVRGTVDGTAQVAGRGEIPADGAAGRAGARGPRWARRLSARRGPRPPVR